MTNDPLSRPIVPPAREGHRRAFSDEDKRRIVEEAGQPGASLSAVARRCGIAARVLFRWKQELAPTPEFVVSAPGRMSLMSHQGKWMPRQISLNPSPILISAVPCACGVNDTGVGSADVHDKSALPPIADELLQRSETT